MWGKIFAIAKEEQSEIREEKREKQIEKQLGIEDRLPPPAQDYVFVSARKKPGGAQKMVFRQTHQTKQSAQSGENPSAPHGHHKNRDFVFKSGRAKSPAGASSPESTKPGTKPGWVHGQAKDRRKSSQETKKPSQGFR